MPLEITLFNPTGREAGRAVLIQGRISAIGILNQP
jgi:hypothetical protein